MTGRSLADDAVKRLDEEGTMKYSVPALRPSGRYDGIGSIRRAARYRVADVNVDPDQQSGLGGVQLPNRRRQTEIGLPSPMRRAFSLLQQLHASLHLHL